MARTKKTGQEATAAAQEASDSAPGTAYTVVWHVKADGRLYAPGDQVALTEADAQRLLASGAIAPANITE